MRGKLSSVLWRAQSAGITPAHAGKTSVHTAAVRPRWDHPRACGENKGIPGLVNVDAGSPPRMRGKLKPPRKTGALEGITPAHAGKTTSLLCKALITWDHPRACGENNQILFTKSSLSGSPPRMRGKLSAHLYSSGEFGITPAHAGKTLSACRTTTSSRDHPRACGENLVENDVKMLDAGSPPRMRGKRLRLIVPLSRTGITPAHAGKTLRKWLISLVDPSPQPQYSLTSRRADASSGSQRAPCAAPV